MKTLRIPTPEQFTGWTTGDGSSTDGYNVHDYFENGQYLGPDSHGIEPTFEPEDMVTVSQTFEIFGDPCTETVTESDAENTAEHLKVSLMETFYDLRQDGTAIIKRPSQWDSGAGREVDWQVRVWIAACEHSDINDDEGIDDLPLPTEELLEFLHETIEFRHP